MADSGCTVESPKADRQRRSRPKRDGGDFPIERPVHSDHRSFADFEAKINIRREQSFACAHRRGGQGGD